MRQSKSKATPVIPTSRLLRYALEGAQTARGLSHECDDTNELSHDIKAIKALQRKRAPIISSATQQQQQLILQALQNAAAHRPCPLYEEAKAAAESLFGSGANKTKPI